MEFLETPAFSKYVSDYLNDDEYRKLQAELAGNPEAGISCRVQADFGRCAGRMYGAAKVVEVGLRIVYYNFRFDHQIWLMTLYDKDEASDLTVKEKRALKAAIESELAARRARRVRPVKWRRV